MPCYAMPCHAMPCHAMPCHAMPYHTVSNVLVLTIYGIVDVMKRVPHPPPPEKNPHTSIKRYQYLIPGNGGWWRKGGRGEIK